MGRRDANGKRIKWANWEKKLVKELKSQGLQLSRSVLEYRSRAERLGKLPLQNPSENIEGDPMTTTIMNQFFTQSLHQDVLPPVVRLEHRSRHE